MRMLLPRSARWMWKRHYHKYYVTENIQYFTRDEDKVSVDPKTLRINKRITKPICIQLNYMAAADRYVKKYADLILEEGMDVVSVHCLVRHVLQPVTGVQKTAYDLLRLMYANNATYVLYGLSIGNYVWSETLVHAMKNPKLYRPVFDRIAVQIWDSIANLKYTPTGIPYTLFPNAHKHLFAIAVTIYEFYLKSCHSTVTAHYNKAEDTFLHTPAHAPALFLLSKGDIISQVDNIQRIYENWQQNGIKCTWQCWDKSPHVMHYKFYPEEYRNIVRTHIHQHLSEAAKCQLF